MAKKAKSCQAANAVVPTESASKSTSCSTQKPIPSKKGSPIPVVMFTTFVAPSGWYRLFCKPNKDKVGGVMLSADQSRDIPPLR